MKPMSSYITEYIVKKKLDKFIDSEDHYEYFPKSKATLQDKINILMKQGIYDFNCIDTSAITDMSYLFKYIDLNNVNFDISKWNVSNVTDMNHMFSGCESFDCDLSKWNVSKVKNMSNIIYLYETFKSIHNRIYCKKET